MRERESELQIYISSSPGVSYLILLSQVALLVHNNRRDSGKKEARTVLRRTTSWVCVFTIFSFYFRIDGKLFVPSE